MRAVRITVNLRSNHCWYTILRGPKCVEKAITSTQYGNQLSRLVASRKLLADWGHNGATPAYDVMDKGSSKLFT